MVEQRSILSVHRGQEPSKSQVLNLPSERMRGSSIAVRGVGSSWLCCTNELGTFAVFDNFKKPQRHALAVSFCNYRGGVEL